MEVIVAKIFQASILQVGLWRFPRHLFICEVQHLPVRPVCNMRHCTGAVSKITEFLFRGCNDQKMCCNRID